MDQAIDLPEPAAAPDAPRSIDDIAAEAIDIAGQRAADREAGRQVPDELPRLAERRGEARGRPVDRAAPKPTADAVLVPAEAPSGWPDERRASFGRLPPEAQRIVLEQARSQDEDHGRKSRDLVAQAQRAEPFIRAYVDNHEFLDAQSERVGVKPHEIMGNMAAVLRAGTTGTPQQRVQALGYVAHLFGVDPRTLGA